MRRLALMVVLAAAALPLTAGAQTTTPFDGAWKVTLTCPPHSGSDDDAKGYTHRFSGEVRNGTMLAVRGLEEDPGWHRVSGPIGADGAAILKVEGIVNSERYAINKAQRGKFYSYRIKAQFDADSGTGQRLTGRTCTFRFER